MTPKENFLRAIYRRSPEWVPNGYESVVTIHPPVDERPVKAGPDCFGCIWALEEEAEGGTFPDAHGAVLDSLENWREKLVVPDIDSLDWSETRRQAESVDRSRYLISVFVHMGLFERSYLLLGMENALVAYITQTDEMRALLHEIADYKIRLIERLYEETHMDMIWYGDDWGTQRNSFLPPDIWRKTVGAETKRIYDWLKAHGVFITQHSCGKIDSIFGDIVEMGAQMFNPCQPCNDLRGMKEKYGDRISFYGGIDSQFVLGRPGVTPEEVDAEVKLRMDEMKGEGGYVAGPSQGVPYDPVIINAMNEAIKKYGRY